MSDTNEALRLHVGCGNVRFDGWVNLDCRDMAEADARYDMTHDPLPYPDNSVEEIHCAYTFEHIPPMKHAFCLGEWLRVLKPGGVVQVIVPNIVLLCQQTVNANAALEKGIDSIDPFSGVPAFEAFYSAMVTLFSMDEDELAGEPCRHRWGFSEIYLTEVLRRNGFVDVEPWGEQATTIISLSARKPG